MINGENMTDAELAKAIRKRLGLTQAEMAKALGYENRRIIGTIETGKRPLSRTGKKLVAHLLCHKMWPYVNFWAKVAFFARNDEMKTYAIRRYINAYYNIIFTPDRI